MREAKFCIGQIVHHQLFDYRGVIVDVDFKFSGSEKWYEEVARSRPPKDRPWYHVLVDNAIHQTYVAERNLEISENKSPIHHPRLDEYFSGVEGGYYIPRFGTN
ncbi:MAG: heat shock protein HspQ [Gammaproteobacteria bacterium]